MSSFFTQSTINLQSLTQSIYNNQLSTPLYSINLQQSTIYKHYTQSSINVDIWNTSTNALRYVDCVMDLFDQGKDNGFLEHRLLVLMDSILEVELGFLRQKSNDQLEVFAANYAFVEEDHEDDNEDKEDNKDNGDTDTLHPSGVKKTKKKKTTEDGLRSKKRSTKSASAQCFVFGRLLNHYLKKQATAALIPLLRPFCHDILAKSDSTHFQIKWNNAGTHNAEAEMRENENATTSDDDEDDTTGNIWNEDGVACVHCLH